MSSVLGFTVRFLLMCLLVPVPSQAATPIRQQSFNLPNGMRVTVIEVHQNPVIASTVVVRVGLSHETPEINGVSHLLEHLTFNGTDSRTQEAFYRDLDRHGCYCNASTGDDYTAYYLLTRRDQFAEGLALQADMLLRAAIPADKIEKEKQIVLEEIRKDRGRPGYEAESAVRAFLFRDTPYAMRVIGSPESVRRISRDAIVTFYRAWYRPENMEMLIVGDTTVDMVRPLVTRLFGAVTRSDHATEIKPVSIHTGNGMQVLAGGNLPRAELRLVFDLKRLRDDMPQLELFVQLLDRHLKKRFRDRDPRIAASLDVNAAAALLVVKTHLGADPTQDQAAATRDDLLAAMGKVEFERDAVLALQRKRRIDDLYGLERPHFFGMLAAPSIAAGTFTGLVDTPVDMKSIQSLGRVVVRLPRADLLILPGGER